MTQDTIPVLRTIGNRRRRIRSDFMEPAEAYPLGANTLYESATCLADAYQIAAHEIERVQRLPWQELEPCEDAPWRFGAGQLADLHNARGHLTIVSEFEGNPATKQIIVALEWEHERQGRRTVRLVTLVNRPS